MQSFQPCTNALSAERTQWQDRFNRLQGAEVVEWQTRTFEGRVAQAVRVQVPPSAPNLPISRCQAAVRRFLMIADVSQSLQVPLGRSSLLLDFLLASVAHYRPSRSPLGANGGCMRITGLVLPAARSISSRSGPACSRRAVPNPIEPHRWPNGETAFRSLPEPDSEVSQPARRCCG